MNSYKNTHSQDVQTITLIKINGASAPSSVGGGHASCRTI